VLHKGYYCICRCGSSSTEAVPSSGCLQRWCVATADTAADVALCSPCTHLHRIPLSDHHVGLAAPAVIAHVLASQWVLPPVVLGLPTAWAPVRGGEEEAVAEQHGDRMTAMVMSGAGKRSLGRIAAYGVTVGIVHSVHRRLQSAPDTAPPFLAMRGDCVAQLALGTARRTQLIAYIAA
jgi:hypothetical protein